MSRDANGNYTLPSGNPVVSGTTIDATWANPTMTDIGAEITNSLDRNGQGGMLAPLKGVDGTVSLPALAFTSEPSTGLFLNATGDLRLTLAGVNAATFQAGGVQYSGTGPYGFGATDVLQQFTLGGTFTSPGTSTRVHGFSTVTAVTGVAGDTGYIAGVFFACSVVTQTATEDIGYIAQVDINEPQITDNLTGDITVASTVRIRNAPTEGLTNYAVHIQSGDVALDSGNLTVAGDVAVANFLDFTSSGLTISSGSATPTRSVHTILGEGGVDDDLVTLVEPSSGIQLLILTPGSDSQTITVKSTGNIVLDAAGDFVMNSNKDAITLLFVGSSLGWLEISRSNNGS